jgi:hypothetical protein
VAPPLARSFQNTAHRPLPDQSRRKRTGSCIGDDEQPFGQVNKTHHFHKYTKAVDAHKLTPPFRRNEWETLESVKAKRRAGTIIMDPIDLEKMKAQEGDKMQEDETEEEGKLLNLYVCCQCSFYCVASGVIPGFIPRKFWDEFIREKKSSPPPGKTGELNVVLALETLLMCVTLSFGGLSCLHLLISFNLGSSRTYCGRVNPVCFAFIVRASNTRWAGIQQCGTSCLPPFLVSNVLLAC